MSVTPDFVGQVYKDTNTGNIWRANSLTPGDWTLEVQNYKMFWQPTSVKLYEKIGFFSYTGDSGASSIVFRGQSNIPGIDIEVDSTLQSFSCPDLVYVDQLSVQFGYVNITDNAILSSILFPLLVSTGSKFDVSGNSSLLTLDISSLQSCSYLDCSGPSSITSLDLSSLQSVTNTISLTLCSSLATLDVSSLASFAGNFECDGCALNVASVDGVLSQLVSIAAYVAGTVKLDGGTNAHPSPAGMANKATLEGRGVVVNINP